MINFRGDSRVMDWGSFHATTDQNKAKTKLLTNNQKLDLGPTRWFYVDLPRARLLLRLEFRILSPDWDQLELCQKLLPLRDL